MIKNMKSLEINLRETYDLYEEKCKIVLTGIRKSEQTGRQSRFLEKF